MDTRTFKQFPTDSIFTAFLMNSSIVEPDATQRQDPGDEIHNYVAPWLTSDLEKDGGDFLNFLPRAERAKLVFRIILAQKRKYVYVFFSQIIGLSGNNLKGSLGQFRRLT